MVGIVTRGDVLADDDGDGGADPGGPVLALARGDVVTLGPHDTALDAMHLMVAEGVDHIPVVDGGRLVGICTRTDLLEVRRAQWEHDVPQDGLRRRRSAKLDR